MRIFFSSDIHASNTVFRKFLNGVKIYQVDLAILLGDLTGKLLIPLVRKAGGGWETSFMGRPLEVHTEQELDDLKKLIEKVGYYWIEQTPDEFAAMQANPQQQEATFTRLALERLREWMALADERLGPLGIKVYMAPGNDDVLECDDVIRNSACIVDCADEVVMVGDHEMVTFSWTNPTPWETHREKPDAELEPMLEALISRVRRLEWSIFNFHAPPHGCALDMAPVLTKDLVQALDRKEHVGSKAVTKMIKKYRPFLSLHGHIHESRGIQKMGRTTMINPGSEYSEGILRGVILEIDRGEVKDFIFTSG